jgi:death-on-curing protein
MKMLDYNQVLIFHQKIINQTGGIHGLRNEGQVISALHRGHASYSNQELYPTDILKIAAITHGLICNHGFIDGNKRIGIGVMLLLINMNGISIRYTQEELINLGLAIASGTEDVTSIENWIVTKIY